VCSLCNSRLQKKDKKAAAAAPAAPSAAAQYAAMASAPSAAPSSSFSSGGDIDLTSFADGGARSNRHAQQSGDFDFLSGSAGGGDLTTQFANTSIAPTLWDNQAQDGEFEGGNGGFEAPQQHGAAAPAKKQDLWASNDLFNLEKLDQAPQQPKKGGVVEGGVSMSMMKGMNPNAVATPKRANNGAQPGFGAPQPGFGGPQGGFGGPQGGFGGPQPGAFAHNGGFAAPGGFPPQLGPSYGQGYGQPMGYGHPQQGYPGMQPGFPQQQQFGGMQGGYPGMQQGGMQGGFPQQGRPGPPQFSVSAAQQQQQQQPQSMDPFASLTPSLGHNRNAQNPNFFVAGRK
jgi:hypothetical protein